MTARLIKGALLIAILALPVGLYLFLQSFGENQYSVPVIYQGGIQNPLEGCPATEDASLPDFPYTDSEQHVGSFSDHKGRLYVVSFLQSSCDPEDRILNEVARVANSYRDDQRVGAISLLLSDSYPLERWKTVRDNYGLSGDQWNLWRVEAPLSLVRCAFNLETENCNAAQQLILLDGQLRVRGIYQALDLEEVDRLITEMEILLLNNEDESNADG